MLLCWRALAISLAAALWWVRFRETVVVNGDIYAQPPATLLLMRKGAAGLHARCWPPRLRFFPWYDTNEAGKERKSGEREKVAGGYSCHGTQDQAKFFFFHVLIVLFRHIMCS